MEGHRDQEEVQKFDKVADDWWDTSGVFRPLHTINPLRLQYVSDVMGGLQGTTVLDVGCGGGILSEALAKKGAKVTGIDLSPGAIDTAKLHSAKNNLEVEYLVSDAQSLLGEQAEGCFDCVVCMELLEHVTDPLALVKSCGTLVRPQGNIFFSTINRTIRSLLLAVLTAEYILGIIPRGTHSYRKLIKPSELAEMSVKSGLEVLDIKGIRYFPYIEQARLTSDPSTNYLMHCRRNPS